MRPFVDWLVLTVALSSGAVCGQGKIKWEKDFQAALARAKQENKPLVACFSMSGERVCDVTIKEHYADSKIVKLSRQTVNLFCSPHGTDAQKEMEKRVRLDLLKQPPDAYMVAPQHVFFAPDGKVLLSCPYYIVPGELEWMWSYALRLHDESFQWESSDRMRAPKRLQQKIKKLTTVKVLPEPPTKQELDAILREIKKGFGYYSDAAPQMHVIVRHPSTEAKKFVERLLKSIENSNADRVAMLKKIAENSPRKWWDVAAPLLSHEASSVRIAAADCLRELGERRAVKSLYARWRKEDSAEVKGALLAAMVACGPADRNVVKLIPFVVKDYDDERVRLHALVAAAGLENRKAVAQSVQTALADPSARLRQTAAYVVAVRRDAELAGALGTAAAAEADADVKRWLEQAVAVVNGGSMDAFDGFLEDVIGSR